MSSVNTFSLYSSKSAVIHFINSVHHCQWPLRPPKITVVYCSMGSRNRRRRRKLATSTETSPDPKIETVIDLNQLSTRASSSFQTLYDSSELKIRQFVYYGKEAYRDLQTLITFDENRRILVSCRRSTLEFLGILVILSFLVVFAFRVLIKLSLRFRGGNRFGYNPLVRRDRSLGGKEVIVGSKVKERGPAKYNSGSLSNPLSPAQGAVGGGLRRKVSNRGRIEKKFPKWWPTSTIGTTMSVDMQEYQREANRMVRAIMDNRMGGKDIMENDIIQLRQICRISGVRVYIDTENIRDSLYRASVDFVLDVCSRSPSNSTFVDIDGEDARQFIAGLAENIGLESIRAVRIVSAAVAGRTRSRFLQAWALKMQGKHAEAKVELSKICLLLRVFPPEESSPEMEMVARGLEKHLNVEQREYLMDVLVGICDEDSSRTASEALGLMHYWDGGGNNHVENKSMR
ncbi:Phosphoribosylformylglycinamidine synthase [Quillaja saponaria]|uniref:Phosphoribosylformylglycinamidine synthase n=1 Tax=Quillaja saponaria TaxID=32244 RepID=A0AAD7LHW0_QUISA|nr:Phosphoribosylformylglycinamidine synthase [Quillaja saponaria]